MIKDHYYDLRHVEECRAFTELARKAWRDWYTSSRGKVDFLEYLLIEYGVEVDTDRENRLAGYTVRDGDKFILFTLKYSGTNV